MCALSMQAMQETFQPILFSTGSNVCLDILKRPAAKAILKSGIAQSLYL